MLELDPDWSRYQPNARRSAEVRMLRERSEGTPAQAERPVTVRLARPEDARAVNRLADLDSAAVPAPPWLLAELDGVLASALSLSSGAVIADPFLRTTQLVEVLRLRARQLERERRRAVGWSWRPALGGLLGLRSAR